MNVAKLDEYRAPLSAIRERVKSRRCTDAAAEVARLTTIRLLNAGASPARAVSEGYRAIREACAAKSDGGLVA